LAANGVYESCVILFFLRKQYFVRTQPNNDFPLPVLSQYERFYATGKISYAGAEIVKK
jgi:hypothetical protein